METREQHELREREAELHRRREAQRWNEQEQLELAQIERAAAEAAQEEHVEQLKEATNKQEAEKRHRERQQEHQQPLSPKLAAQWTFQGMRDAATMCVPAFCLPTCCLRARRLIGPKEFGWPDELVEEPRLQAHRQNIKIINFARTNFTKSKGDRLSMPPPRYYARYAIPYLKIDVSDNHMKKSGSADEHNAVRLANELLAAHPHLDILNRARDLDSAKHRETFVWPYPQLWKTQRWQQLHEAMKGRSSHPVWLPQPTAAPPSLFRSSSKAGQTFNTVISRYYKDANRRDDVPWSVLTPHAPHAQFSSSLMASMQHQSCFERFYYTLGIFQTMRCAL